jgi:hypothetical protein
MLERLAVPIARLHGRAAAILGVEAPPPDRRLRAVERAGLPWPGDQPEAPASKRREGLGAVWRCHRRTIPDAADSAGRPLLQ